MEWQPRTEDHECGAAGITPEEMRKIIEEAQAQNELEDGLDEARIEILRKKAATMYRKIQRYGTWEAKGGTGSGGADRWAEALEKGATVKWEQLLKRTLRTLVGKLNAESKTEASFARLSRRTLAQYMGEETPLEPALFASPFGFDVALAVDTSASVDDYGLAQALREAAMLLRAPGVGRVLWMSIDWAVAAVHEVMQDGVPSGKRAAMRKFQPFLKGGGGTDMSQAIYYVIKVNKQRKRSGQPRIPAVVVFTDGGTDWPPARDVRKSKLQVIVVLISPGATKDVAAYTKKMAPYAKVIVAK
jgi:predicted metal-dependent peptidase